VIYKGEDPWSLSQFKEEIAAKDRYYIVAEADGAVIGYAGVMPAGDLTDILTMTVAPEFRRKGIAREFLKRLIDWSRNKKAVAVMLEVRIDNAEAIPLYEANGFRKISERIDYYGPGKTALVMRKELRS
jgi:ribosomal-protein-alanine N-acetyltransferase